MSQSTKVFVVIVIAQFFGTSLWFGGNVILPQLQSLHEWKGTMLGWVTSMTQLGFIAGTFLFAVLGIVDKYSPSKVFFACSIIASLVNVVAIGDLSSLPGVLSSRFLVGFFLAGIYPVGMKIAADWQERGLGHWLGALVGALVLGTAFPFVLRSMELTPDPESLLIAISLLCFAGGCMVFLLVPDGPFRKFSGKFSARAIVPAFSVQSFRSPALGYFGHMWELYAFWAFVPVVLNFYNELHGFAIDVPLLTFLVIGAGGVGCFFGGRLSLKTGSSKVATVALISSGVCCLLSPFLYSAAPFVFYSVLLFWGTMAAADSPQFSALVARFAPENNRGSAITLVVCIGFGISIISIQLLSYLRDVLNPQYLLLCLSPGPIFGVISMLNHANRSTHELHSTRQHQAEGNRSRL